MARTRAGTAVLDPNGRLFTKASSDLVIALAHGGLQFHEGRICGAWPRVRQDPGDPGTR